MDPKYGAAVTYYTTKNSNRRKVSDQIRACVSYRVVERKVFGLKLKVGLPKSEQIGTSTTLLHYLHMYNIQLRNNNINKQNGNPGNMRCR